MTGVENKIVDTENITIIDDLETDKLETYKLETDKPEADKMAVLRAKLHTSKKDDVINIVATKKRSYNLGIVGSGQAGSRLAESYYKLGYSAICFNTAPQDLEKIQIPEGNKYLLSGCLSGAAKELSLGYQAAQLHKEAIFEMISEKLADAEILILCLSLGGGSGAGSLDTMIDVMSTIGKPIIVLAVLPMNSDDSKTKSNALETLAKLSKEVSAKRISNSIIIDNAKIETLYANVGQLDFFNVSNQAIIEPLDIFNTLSTESSSIKSLDGAEFLKLLVDGNGLSVYGQMTISNYQEDTAIAEAVVSNLSSGLLASGFNIKEARYVGYMIVANKKVWDQIPSSSINYASVMLDELCDSPSVFKGIYSTSDKEDVVKIYSFFSGLSLPSARIEQLKKETAAFIQKSKQKDADRNLNLQLNTGTDDIISAADKIKQQIAQKKSAFGSLVGKK